MRIWSILLGLGTGLCVAWLFGILGVIALLVIGVITLVYAEWQYRQEKVILKERLNIIMTIAREIQSMIDKTRSELEKTESKTS